MELVVLSLGALLIVAAVAWHAVDVLAARRLLVRRRVLLNLVDGRAMAGVLWRRTGRFLVMRDVELMEPGAENAHLDGDVVIERDRVSWVQAT